MSDFQGPLFIVGMPRSGTKLLRDLLNQHPEIGIPTSESHFIPYFIRLFGTSPDLGSASARDDFFAEFTGRNFYGQMQNQGVMLTRDQLDLIPDKNSWDSIFATIFTFYSSTDDKTPTIWGDKTPRYISCTLLLKQVFKNARFLHIVRDPRDCSLSVKHAWNKSLYRAAHQWRIGVDEITKDSRNLESDFMEITYESLLCNPELVLNEICDFLNVEFTPAMMRLGRPTENLGTAKGELDIIDNNQKKYLLKMTPRQIKRIEEITYPALTSKNYTLENNVQFKPLNATALQTLSIYDGLASLGFHIKERGVLSGIRYFYGFHGRDTVIMFNSKLRQLTLSGIRLLKLKRFN